MEADEQSLKILPNYLLIDSDKKYLIEDRFASSLLQFCIMFSEYFGKILKCRVTYCLTEFIITLAFLVF